MQAEVIAFQDECTKDLAAAEPIIKEAEAALNSLDKGSLGELKSFGSPAAEVVQVVSACMVLTAPGGKIPKVQLLPESELLQQVASLPNVQQLHEHDQSLAAPSLLMGLWRFIDCKMLTCCDIKVLSADVACCQSHLDVVQSCKLDCNAVCRTSVGMPARNSWATWTPF